MWFVGITLIVASPFIVGYIACKIYDAIKKTNVPTTVTMVPKRKINSISQHVVPSKRAKASKPRKPRVKKVNGKVQITWRSIYEEDEEDEE